MRYSCSSVDGLKATYREAVDSSDFISQRGEKGLKQQGKTARKGTGEKHGIRGLLEFFIVWYRKFNKDRIPILASGIVYSSLISLVPYVSILVAFLSLFNVLQPFFTLLNDLFTSLFGEEASSQLVSMIEQLTTNASGLGIVGLISFIITSMFLINRVWQVVNQIYRTSPKRQNFLRRVANFFVVLVVGALLLSVYISITSLLNEWVVRVLGLGVLDNRMLQVIRMLVPWAITWLFIFLLIIVAPNAKVQGVSAALGALAGTIAMYVVNAVFSLLITKVFSYSVIYGSLAGLFLFLLWLYLVWIVILGSVQVSYVHQYRPDKISIKQPLSPAEQLANGINVMMIIGQQFKKGKGGTRIRDITERLLMNERQLYTVLDLLVEEGFIIPTNTRNTVYLPAKPLEDMRIVELAGVLYGKVYLEQNLDTIGDNIASQISEKGIKTLGNLSLANLLERI